MDILRFIALLPLKIIYFLRLIISIIFRGLILIFTPIVGKVNWQQPAWAKELSTSIDNLDNWAEDNSYKASGAIFAAILLIGGGIFFYNWHVNHPRTPSEQPDFVAFELNSPSMRNYYDPDSKPSPLYLVFSDSAAPIELSGKDIPTGIRISPAIEGQWKWQDDRRIIFTPKTDWLPGEKYTVNFVPKELLAPQVLVKDNKASFEMTPMSAQFVNSYFYADPMDASLKRAIAELNFNYPVDSDKFEKLLALSLQEPGKKETSRKFNVTYDENKLKAVIQSEPLDMPEKTSVVNVKVNKGIVSTVGGKQTEKELQSNVSVPSLYSLGVSSVSATLVDNKNYEPEQVLLVETNFQVKDTSMNKAVSAFILPPRVYDQATDKYNWNGLEDISETILKQSTPLKLEPIPAEEEYVALNSYKFQAKPGDQLYVKINKDITSFSGYKMPKVEYSLVQVPEFPSMLDFVSEGSLLSLSGDHRLTVVSRNVPGVKLKIKRVLPNQIQHLVSLNRYGSYTKPDLETYRFGEDNITEFFETKFVVPGNDPIKAHYEGVDLSPYFGPNGKQQRGIFLVRLNSYDPNNDKDNKDEQAGQTSSNDDDEYNEYDDYYYDSDSGDQHNVQMRLIVVTDLGILAKTSLDRSHDVYIQSIHTGQPVAGAKVDVLSMNGEVLHSQTTGDDGHVNFPDFSKYQREKKATLYLVTKADDTSFLPVRDYSLNLSYSRFDTSGEDTPKDSGQLSAHLFSDRGIYRPGETFHIGMLVRAYDWAKNLQGMPLEINVIDPCGQMILQKKISLNAMGFEEFAYETAETDPTGDWSVYLYLIKNEETNEKDFIGYTEVKVKEFLPDRMQVKANFNASTTKGWVKPAGLSALVNVQNLFGTPAQNRLVEGQITMRPILPSFAGYSDYSFRSKQGDRDGFREQLEDKRTDAEGNANFELNLANRTNGTYQLQFLAKAYEQDSGRNVAAQASILVSPEDFLVGMKTDGSLSYIKRDASRNINLIALNPNLDKVAANGLKLRYQEKKYLSVLTKDTYSGLYNYVSKLRMDEVSTAPLSISANGQDIALPTNNPGTFVVQVVDANNEILNWLEYTVAGEANLSRSLERNAELELTLSKDIYQPGDEIEIAINAPYAGSGLITIERDRVYAHTWFTSPTTSSVQKIRIPADFVGNGYINVQFVRDPNSPEIFMSPLSYGILPFTTSLDSKRAKLDVEVPDLLKPGDTLNMKVTTNQAEKVIVFAVDEGILQVAKYKLQDPLDTLLPKRRLQVQTAQILDLVLPMFKTILAQSSAPGGGDDSDLSRHLNPFRRKVDAPVAYWSGIVDVNGEKVLKYEIPDYFNGRIRVMAVGVTPGLVGIYQTTTTVRDDFILTPNVPAMVAPGDTFEVTVGVANNLQNQSGGKANLKLSLQTTNQLELVDSKPISLSLGEKEEGVATFTLRAKDYLGAAKLTFVMSHENKKTTRSAEISVRPLEAYRTELELGRMDGSSARVEKLRNMYDEYAVREVSASYLPVVMGRGLASYLEDYPHACTEQLISGAIPYLMQQRHPEFGFANLDAPKAQNLQSKVLAMISARQNSTGGIGTWHATPKTNPFISAYALQYMLELKDTGIAVPENLLKNTTAYLQTFADNPAYNSLPNLRLKAYIAYLIARQEQVPTNLLAMVQKQMDKYYPEQLKTDVASAYMAATYKLLKQDKEADKLMANAVKVLARKNRGEWEWDYENYYDPLVRDASILYILEAHFPEMAAKLPAEALENITAPLVENRYNTLSSSLCILALDKYAARVQAQLDNAELVEGIKILQANSRDESTASQISTMNGLLASASFTADAKLLKLENAAKLPAWFAVQQSGYDHTPDPKPIKNGLEVIREYLDENGEPISEVKLGQEIIVLLKVRSTSSEAVGDAVLVDLLPGGFEHVQNGDSALKIPDSVLNSPNMDLVFYEDREDRSLIYCRASTGLGEMYYTIRATNVGEFTVPALYGESMYDRTTQARSPGGAKIKVVK